MDPERIRLVLRPRSDWESADLGLRLAQSHAGLLHGAWFLSSLPWAALIGSVCIAFERPLLAFLLFWWSKPLYERVLLHLLSRLAFDDRPGRGELLRIALKMPFSAAWLRAITYGRLELSRSFNLPVWQLEGLRGAARRRRAAVLHLGAGGSGPALTLCAFASVWLLFMTLTALVMSLQVRDVMVFDLWSIGPYVESLLEAIATGGPATQATCFAMYYLCEGFVATFYVAAGFCLYLNRRTHLEAWDIELQFRRAVRRRETIGAGSAAAIAAALCLGLLAPPPAHAQGRVAYDTSVSAQVDPAPTDAEREAMRERARTIVAENEFGRTETRRRWRPKPTEPGETDGEQPAWLEAIGKLFGSLTEIVLWIAALGVLLTAFLTRRRWLAQLRGIRRHRERPPERVRGGVLLDQDEMPDDVPARARALWQQGRSADAASLLYRALITTLDGRHRLGVHHSDTEGDCLRRVRRAVPPDVNEYFGQVTRIWQSVAYAHRPPSGDDFTGLCARWYDLVGPEQ